MSDTVGDAAARPLMKQCYTCRKVERKEHSFLRCGNCHYRVYCGVECQRADWKEGHKKECAEIRQHQRSLGDDAPQCQQLEDWVNAVSRVFGCAGAQALNLQKHTPGRPKNDTHYLLIDVMRPEEKSKEKSHRFAVQEASLQRFDEDSHGVDSRDRAEMLELKARFDKNRGRNIAVLARVPSTYEYLRKRRVFNTFYQIVPACSCVYSTHRPDWVQGLFELLESLDDTKNRRIQEQWTPQPSGSADEPLRNRQYRRALKRNHKQPRQMIPFK